MKYLIHHITKKLITNIILHLNLFLSFDCHYRYKTYIFWKKFIISMIKYLKKYYDISLLRKELKYETKMTFLSNNKNIHYSDENNYILNQPLDIKQIA